MFSRKNLKQQFEKLLVNKNFSFNYYQKYYLRKNFLDNNNNIYNYKKSLNLGFSVYTKNYVYSHLYNNKFTFNSFLEKKNLKLNFFLKNCYKSFLNIKNKKNTFIFLFKPVKGGVFSYFLGFIGFIPKNNILILFKNFFLKIKKTYFFIFLYLFIKFKNILKCFRFNLGYVKIKVFLSYRKKNFSKVNNIKKRKSLFNCVFLLKKNWL